MYYVLKLTKISLYALALAFFIFFSVFSSASAYVYQNDYSVTSSFYNTEWFLGFGNGLNGSLDFVELRALRNSSAKTQQDLLSFRLCELKDEYVDEYLLGLNKSTSSPPHITISWPLYCESTYLSNSANGTTTISFVGNIWTVRYYFNSPVVLNPNSYYIGYSFWPSVPYYPQRTFYLMGTDSSSLYQEYAWSYYDSSVGNLYDDSLTQGFYALGVNVYREPTYLSDIDYDFTFSTNSIITNIYNDYLEYNSTSSLYDLGFVVTGTHRSPDLYNYACVDLYSFSSSSTIDRECGSLGSSDSYFQWLLDFTSVPAGDYKVIGGFASTSVGNLYHSQYIYLTVSDDYINFRDPSRPVASSTDPLFSPFRLCLPTFLGGGCLDINLFSPVNSVYSSISSKFPFSWVFSLYDILKFYYSNPLSVDESFTVSLDTSSLKASTTLTLFSFTPMLEAYPDLISLIRTAFIFLIWFGLVFHVVYKVKRFFKV